MKGGTRLRRLREAVDKEKPVDAIHGAAVKVLYDLGGNCPRYLACAVEGSSQSAYRGNPDFFVGDLRQMSDWLAASYEEGWAARWVVDLDTNDRLDWGTHVQLQTDPTAPFFIETAALRAAANEVLVAYVDRLRKAAADGRLHEEFSPRAPLEVVAEVVNRALGRRPDELPRTRFFIGYGRRRRWSP